MNTNNGTLMFDKHVYFDSSKAMKFQRIDNRCFLLFFLVCCSICWYICVVFSCINLCFINRIILILCQQI